MTDFNSVILYIYNLFKRFNITKSTLFLTWLHAVSLVSYFKYFSLTFLYIIQYGLKITFPLTRILLYSLRLKYESLPIFNLHFFI